MTNLTTTLTAMERAWEVVAPRFPAYELLALGSASFACLASACPSHCCKIFSVSLNEREVERMRRFSALEPVEFLESENGTPIELPLAQPYLLARRDGQCGLLGDHLLCGQYEGRPDSCRLYPHFVLFFDPETLRPVHGDVDGMRASMHAVLDGTAQPVPYVPVLIRHLDCPGFVGPPLGEETWRELFVETCRLQYSEAGGIEW